MKSLDTNILVRAVVRDDARQTEIADQLLAEPALVTATALVEMVWVLQSTYGLNRAAICTAFEDLFDLPKLEVQNRSALIWAVERFAAGADFADMCHLALSASADSFVTFDRRVARYAKNSVVPVETL